MPFSRSWTLSNLAVITVPNKTDSVHTLSDRHCASSAVEMAGTIGPRIYGPVGNNPQYSQSDRQNDNISPRKLDQDLAFHSRREIPSNCRWALTRCIQGGSIIPPHPPHRRIDQILLGASHAALFGGVKPSGQVTCELALRTDSKMGGQTPVCHAGGALYEELHALTAL